MSLARAQAIKVPIKELNRAIGMAKPCFFILFNGKINAGNIEYGFG